MSRISIEREECWPFLVSEGYVQTSDETTIYNCIAFAAGVTQEWWWPDDEGVGKWPDGVPRMETIECFVQAYGTLGYEICENDDLEDGFEKVAIYALEGVPTHAARQLACGEWCSKLGRWEDIRHRTLRGVEDSDCYGNVTVLMRRALPHQAQG